MKCTKPGFPERCPKCKKVLTNDFSNGRYTDNEHPLSPVCYFCKCGNTIEEKIK